MLDDHDDRLKQVAEELKRPVRVSRSLDDRVMRAVRAMPRHRHPERSERSAVPLFAKQIRWGLVAAATLLFAALGARALFSDADADAPPAPLFAKKATAPQPVQFVLVAPDAKKVAVVGDFNGWDASHAGYQAKHRGGGVWAVPAHVPLGHHR